MNEPHYRITHTILNNIVKYEVERKGILDFQIDDELVNKLRLNTNTGDIFHLGQTMGVNVTLKKARKIASGKTLTMSDYRGQYLTNFRNAVEFILSTQASFSPMQGNIVLHLNKILIQNIADEWDAKYRTGGEQIDNRDDTWVSLRDEEIASVDVQSQALEAIEWFMVNQNKVHALIRIPATIYSLIRIAPFVIGNKITMLAVLKYLFFKSGYYVNGYMPIIKNFDIYEEEYIEAWKQAASEGDDVTLWIERFSRNYAQEMITTKERIDKMLEDHKEKSKQPFLNLNRRQLKVLRYLQNIPQVKREEYVDMMDVSTMTAYRDMYDLVKKGLLRIEGQGRGTLYVLASK